MAKLTRRGFIKKSSVGAATLGALVAVPRLAEGEAAAQPHAAGGPNFYEFGDDVLYEIHIDNNGDARADITYQFRFVTHHRNPQGTFLYNTGPITALDSPNWNRYQLYTVTKKRRGGATTVLGTGLTCPPCNIGPRSTPDYAALAQAA